MIRKFEKTRSLDDTSRRGRATEKAIVEEIAIGTAEVSASS